MTRATRKRRGMVPPMPREGDPAAEWVSLATIHPWERNPRVIPDRLIEKLAETIRKLGWGPPIVARASDRRIVAGHARRLAAMKLGLELVPVRFVDLDDDRAAAMALADNRLGEEAAWSEDDLAAVLRGIEDEPLRLLAGFEADELDDLLNEGGGPDGANAPSLAERFLVPPFSVLDARQGYWQERKRAWIGLGIKSELGRAYAVPPGGSPRPAAKLGRDGKTVRGDGSGRPLNLKTWNGVGQEDPVSQKIEAAGVCSVFDPVLCEIVYRWFAPPAGRVLDPLAGGSVRGLVASRLGRAYVGVELRPEQVAANREQGERIARSADPAPVWIEGDARDVTVLAAERAPFDLLFSCPPYADLEQYSDDPRDLSVLEYPAFLAAYGAIIRESVALLAPDRFAVFVVGEVREPKAGGAYRGFVLDTIRAFEQAGARFYNEAVLVTMCGSVSIRAGRQFATSRKLGKTHQNVLVFCKGSPTRATRACEPVVVGDLTEAFRDAV